MALHKESYCWAGHFVRRGILIYYTGVKIMQRKESLTNRCPTYNSGLLSTAWLRVSYIISHAAYSVQFNRKGPSLLGDNSYCYTGTKFFNK